MTETFYAPTLLDFLNQRLDPEDIDVLARYGASSGIPGLTYTRETVALYDRYESDVWDRLRDDADAYGHKSVLAYIASFGGAEHVSDSDGFKNLLVWAVAESYAVSELLESEDQE